MHHDFFGNTELSLQSHPKTFCGPDSSSLCCKLATQNKITLKSCNFVRHCAELEDFTVRDDPMMARRHSSKLRTNMAATSDVPRWRTLPTSFVTVVQTSIAEPDPGRTVNRHWTGVLTQFWCSSALFCADLVWPEADRFCRGRTFAV